jgi:DNA-binding HxlR family transcriptional regulator
VSPLIENLLKVQATDHRKIQEEIQENLRKLGYEVKLEKKIWAGREGKIDVFAQKGNFTVGLEVDHSQLRKKSIDKLNALKPSLAIFLLKAENINRNATYSRAKLIRVNSLLVHLPEKRVEKIGPRFSEYKQEETPAAIQRYKKFERSETSPKFRISELDFKILRDLADYRVLDTRHILALHSEAYPRTIQRRLQLLFQAGFLERPVYQSQYKTPSHIVYTLSRKGAQLLFPDDERAAKWSKQLKPLFLWHSLMVSDFRVILTLALKGKKESKLAKWQEDDLTDNVYLEGERLPISPDAFFTIEDKNDLLHFFLEIDRSTMEGKRFLKKMKAYWQWWKEEGHKDRFNISVFRVLTVAVSEERKENLRRITKLADDNRQGSEMFLFACQKDYGLEKPESILKPIWQSPKDDNLHHLLE